MALKNSFGADIKVVFMTDGRHSHDQYISPNELAIRREEEAISACSILGIPSEQIFFLGFPDSDLASYKIEAVRIVTKILAKNTETQVFTPYRFDLPPDHKSTTDIVKTAIHQNKEPDRKPITILEYPIWFWHHWPFVSIKMDRNMDVFSEAWISFISFYEHFFHLKTYVEIGDTRSVKWDALCQHRTQMDRPKDKKDWPILSDVSSGQWLATIFGEREYFFKYTT